MIRVLLADDQALVRAGFRMLMRRRRTSTSSAEAANGGQAVALARERHPDVVLMDLRMPEVDGHHGDPAGSPPTAAGRGPGGGADHLR